MRISRNARRVTSGRVVGVGMGRYVWVGGGLVALLCMQAIAGPEGENVVAGSATFQRNGANTLVTTGSQNTIIDYRSFNIGSNEFVRIQQPSADSRVLNRVPNSVMPTRIDGQLSSNGIVYIANASGVYFGQHAIVNAAGVYAAAGQITNQDFLNNVNHFTALTGDVINQGTIVGGTSGVALLGKHVGNAGSISAPDGLVALASGDSVYITQARGHMMVEVSGGDSGDAAHGTGNTAGPSRPGVENTGRITARQTRLQSGDLYSLAIRMPGEIRSSDVVVQAGANAVRPGARGGAVEVSGVIDASNRQPGGVGGSVEVLGDRVSLRGASIDASGSAGGGSVMIGGDYQGGGGIQRARHTAIDGQTAVHADAIDSGNGGRVIVWSDRTTRFNGNVSVKGGAQSGDGGFVEVSSAGQLGFTGRVNTTAPNGELGQLLLDPTNIRIVAAGGNVTNFNQVDAFADADRDVPGTQSLITVTDLNSQAATVTLQATNSITFETAVNMTMAGAGINAQAGNTITVNSGASITTNGGPITFEVNQTFAGPSAPAPDAVGTININANITTNGGAITLRSAGNSGSGSGININADLSSGAGAIVLDFTSGTGGITFGDADVTIETRRLDTDGGNVTITGSLILSDSLVIDTEQGDDTAAGAVNLSGATTISSAFGYDLSIDTSSAASTAGAISLGTVTGSSIGFVNRLTLNAGGATPAAITLGGSVSLDGDGIETGDFTVSGGSRVVLSGATTTIDTEQPGVGGSDGDAGDINLGGVPVSATAALFPILNLNASVTNATSAFDGGDVSLGAFTNAAGGLVRQVNINNSGTTGTAPGAAGQVTLAGNISLDSNGGANPSLFSVTGGATVIDAATLTIDTESGDNDVAGNITFAGPLTTTAGNTATTSLTLDASTAFATGTGGAVSIGAVNDAGGGFVRVLDIRTGGGASGAAGLVTLSGSINLDSTDGSAAFSVANGGLTVINANITIDTEQANDGSAGSIDLSGTTLTAASGSASLRTLTLDTSTSNAGSDGGNIALGNVSDVTAALNDVTINMDGDAAGNDGTLTLGGTITLDSNGGDLSGFTVNNGAVILTGNTIINMESGANGDAGNVTFGPGVTINGGSSLTINAIPQSPGSGAAGDVTINAAVGGIAALSSFTASGDEISVNNVRTSGNQSFTARDVNFNGGAAGILSTGAGTLTVRPLAVGTNLSIGTVSSGDGFVVDDTLIGAFTGGMTFGRADGTGLVTIGQSTFINDITVLAGGAGGRITLEAGDTLSTAAANRDITLRAGTGNTGQLSTGNGAVITAGAGDIELTADSMNLAGGNNTISTTSTVTLQPASVARPMVIGAVGAASDFALSTTELANISNGSSGIFLGRTDSSGAMSISAVTFQDPVTFRAPASGGSIAVNGQITGIDDADISFLGSGETTTLNADIVTAANNDISFDDSVIIGVSAVNLTTSGTGFITFNGKVDGASAGGQTLQVNAGAGGTVVFFDNIGGTGSAGTPLGLLDINAGTLELMPNAQNIRTTGAAGGVDFTGVTTVVVRSNLTIDTDATGGSTAAGSILFGSTPLTAPGGPVALSFDATADNAGARGDVTIADVGTIPLPVAFFTVRAGTLTLDGDVSAAGFVNFDDVATTTLAQTVTIDNTGGTNAAISLRNVGGNFTLTVTGDAGSAINLVGADLDTLSLVSGGTLTLSGLIETDTAQNYSNVANIVLAADTTLTAQDSDAANARQNITLGATNDVTGAFGLTINGATVSLASIGQGGGADPTFLNVNASNGATLLAVQVGGDVDVTTTGGSNITVGLIDAGTNVVDLSSGGTIEENAADADADVIGSAVTMTAVGDIGAAFGGIETRAITLNLTTFGASADIVVTEVDAAPGDTTSLSATTNNGSITVTNEIGSLAIGAVTAGVGGDISLTATAGTIFDDTDDAVADITGPGAVNLVAATGIGNGNGTLDLDVSTLTSATSATGGVRLTLLDPDSSGVTVTSATATTSGDIVINSTSPSGDITVNNANTNDGNIEITAETGNLIVGGSGIVVDSGVANGTHSAQLTATDGVINLNASILADDGDISLTASDLDIAIAALISTTGGVTFASVDSGNIGVGMTGAMPGMSISNAELDNVTAGSLTIATTGGDGDIVVDGITIASVMDIGEVRFLATGGDNQITFDTAASQFNALNASADNGVIVNFASVPMTTVGNLTLDGDADNSEDMGVNHDSVVLAPGITLESTGDLTLNAANGTILGTGAVTFTAGGAINLGGAMSVGSLMLIADDGITISENITSAGAIDIDADADTDGDGTFTVNSGAMVVTNNSAIGINAADLDLDDGSLDAGGGPISLTVSDGSDAHLGGAGAMGDMNISAAELLNVISNGFTLTTDGSVTVDGITAFNSGAMAGTVSGTFTINANGPSSTVTFENADSFFDSLAVSAHDVIIGDDIFAEGDAAFGRSSVGTLGLGDAMGDMSISKAELALIHADNATFGGANVTAILVDNVAATDVANITGLVTLDATRDAASITFQNAASAFRTLTAIADDGIALNADLSTTIGDLRLDGDADNAADTSDAITLTDGRLLHAGIALVLDATTGGINGAGITNLSAIQGIIVNDSLTSDGTLTINSDANGDGFGALTFLTGTVNSTTNDNIAITAANVFINGTLDAGNGTISIVRANEGAARLGGTDPGAGVLWVDNAELGRLTCLGFTFGGAAATLVEVDGVTTGGAPGISGTTILSALGTEGTISFINNDSSFRALTVQANNGVTINRSLSTTAGLLQVDGDVNLVDDGNDIVTIAESVNLTSATGMFVSASGGLALTGAFGTTNTFTSGSDGNISLGNVNAPSGAGLTINSQGDAIITSINIGAGTLVVSADSDNDGMNTLSSRGAIIQSGNVLFSGGGTGTNDTIELFFDINSSGAIVLQNAATVVIGGSVDPEVNLTASNGAIDIVSNIGLIRLDGADNMTNTFTNANASMSFAPIVATNDAGLRLVSSGVASIRTIDLNDGVFTADAGLSNIDANPVSIEAMNITINRAVTTQMGGTFSVIVNNNGVFTTDSASTFNLDGAFTQTEGGLADSTQVNFGGSVITSNDNISFASPVRIRGTNTTFNTGASAGDIIFLDTVDAQDNGANDLTLTAGTGNIRFEGAVGQGIDGLIDVLTIQTANNVTFNAAAFVNALAQSAGTGTTTFNGTLISQGAQGIDLNGNIFFFNENVASINGTNGGFSLTNAGDATFADGKTYQFEGAFIQDGPGRVTLGAGIATDNDAMSFTGPITVRNDLQLATGGGNMTFSNTVNDNAVGSHNLRLDAGDTGDIVFNANAHIGGSNAFRSVRAAGQDVQVRNITTRGGDITLLPLLTLRDVNDAADVGAANGVPGTLRGQDLRPDGVLTIIGDLTSSNGGTVRLAQSVDGANAIDNNGHTFTRSIDGQPTTSIGIPSVATIVFGNSATNSPDTFTITSSGNIEIGQFEKIAVFGNLELSSPGTVRLTDVSVTGNLSVTAGTIEFRRRADAFLVDPNAADPTLPDAGPGIAAAGTITLNGSIVLVGTGEDPSFGSTNEGNVSGAVGFVPLRLNSGQIPSFDRLTLNDGTVLTVNVSGVGNFDLASALASALPRENRFEVSTDVTVGKAQREVLQAMRIYARDLTAEELQDFLSGRSFYNDTEKGLSPDAVAEDYEVTVNRLYPPLVDRLVGPYLRVFYKPTVNAAGEQVLTIDDNAGKRTSAEIKDVLTKSLTRFMGDATGTPDPLAFRAYLESTPGEEEPFYIVQNLGEFLTELQLLGLGPREETNARRAVFDPIRPNKFTSLSQFERLLQGEMETVSAE